MFGGIAFAGDDGPNDAHSRHTGDVRDDVVQLHIHFHQRLLHVLDMRGTVFQQPFTQAHVAAQLDDLLMRPEACPQQPVGMQLLQPLSVVDIGLATTHGLRVPDHLDG